LIKPVTDFARRLNAKIILNSQFVVEKEGRYYLLKGELRSIARNGFFYAGLYLGKVKKHKFFPSFVLLKMLAETEANGIIVDDKAAWLFICGRDIFGKRITALHGSRRKGDYTLILNSFGECLGFGRIIEDIDAKTEVVVKNVSDVGDFLRREK
jgi:ribosome biogenesis protein Nip4